MAYPKYEEAVKTVAEQLPYLAIIDNAVHELGNGIVSFDIRVHQGQVQDVVIKTQKRVKIAANERE